MHLFTSKNNLICAELQKKQAPFKRLSDKIRATGWQRDFLRTLESATGDKWHLRHAEGGALAACYEHTQGWSVFYCGSPSVFGSPLVWWAQVNHWKAAKRVLKEYEEREAKREEEEKKDQRAMSDEFADTLWNMNNRLMFT
jgi:hypothetical protein